MTAKRELIEPHKGDKRYVRRNAKGGSRRATMSAVRCPRTGAARPRQSPSRARATGVTAA